MATGEMPTTPTASSPPPPYSTVDGSKGGGQPPYPPYPTDGHQGGYPTPQTNAPYPGGYPPPGAYPPPGYPPQSSYPPQSGYPPAGAYSQHGAPVAGYYPGPTTQQPVVVHTTTSTVMVHAGDRCIRCSGGRVTEHFTLGGICCAVCLFPCGIICCLSSRIRSCNNCGAVYM